MELISIANNLSKGGIGKLNLNICNSLGIPAKTTGFRLDYSYNLFIPLCLKIKQWTDN